MKTDERILRAAAELLANGGISEVSFDALAGKLGITKQAVLYWFPSKQALVSAMFASWLHAETEAALSALESSGSAKEAVAAFVREITRFHLSDLNRYRMMYLVPQTLGRDASSKLSEQTLDKIHAETDRLYEALARYMPGESVKARQQAMVIHSSALGLILMLSLADGVGDPLKHDQEDLVNELIERLS